MSGSGGVQLPMVSEKAEKVVHGGTAGGSGDTMKGKNKIVSCLGNRIPTIVLGAVYLIMVFAGWWPRLICLLYARNSGSVLKLQRVKR